MSADAHRPERRPRAVDAWRSLEDNAERLSRGETATWPEVIVALQAVALPQLQRNWRRLDPNARCDTAEEAAHDVFVRVLERLRARDYATLRRYFGNEPDQAAAGGSRGVMPGEHVNQRGSFRAFIRTILARATIDHQRLNGKYRRASRAKRPPDLGDPSRPDHGSWYSFVMHYSGAGAGRDPITLWNTARQMLEYLDHTHQMARDYVAQFVLSSGARRSQQRPERTAYAAVAELLGLSIVETGGVSAPDWAAARDLVERGARYRQAIELEMQGHSQTEIARSLGLSRRVTQRMLAVAKRLLQARFATV